MAGVFEVSVNLELQCDKCGGPLDATVEFANGDLLDQYKPVLCVSVIPCPRCTKEEVKRESTVG